MTRIVRNLPVLLAFVLAQNACGGSAELGPPGPGDPADGELAYLVIVGEPNVYLEGSDTVSLAVRYQDESGEPLAGEVSFELTGTVLGSDLSIARASTGPDGVARVEVLAGSTPTSFRVVGSAAAAASVSWRVTVGGEAVLPLSAVGDYSMDSQFDLVSGLPGTAGDIINTLLDMTDDPFDPATWLLDEIGGSAGDLISPLRPFLDAFLNELLLAYAPEFLEDLIDVADDVGQVARRFGVVSELAVEQVGATLVGSHRVLGVYFLVDGVRHEYSIEELQWDPIVATSIPVSLDATHQLVVGEHELPVSYGDMLLFALNHVVVPAADPGAHNLQQLLDRAVDCGGIAADLSYQYGLGAVGEYLISDACKGIVGGIAGWVRNQIKKIGGDEGTVMVIRGDAKAVDGNQDTLVDELRNGLWEGEFRFGALTSILGRPDQRFSGERMATF